VIAALDLRNGSLAIGLGGDGRWAVRVRTGIAGEPTSDDFRHLLARAAREAGIAPGEIKGSILSSVVPRMNEPLRSGCEAAFGALPAMAGPGMRSGLKIRTDIPSEVGTDLVCEAVAARARTPGNLVIVDAGAAFALTAVSANGDFLGASIAPGYRTSAKALREGAAQLPEAPTSPPERFIGKNTRESLASGLAYGFKGLLDALTEGMAAEMGGEVAVVGTGTDPKPLVSPSRGFLWYDPWLILDGLALIAAMNGIPS
jgi:type III pantothenate kinase